MNSATRNPNIDGLRGLAILMVMAYHYFGGFFIFDFGWMGVDLFFVLSGYLLTGRLYPYISTKNIIYKFYRNRFFRIVPLAFAFLTLFFLSFYIFASANTIDSLSLYFNNKTAIFLFLTNWVLIFHSSGASGPLGHLWSLAIEEQYYLIFPLFITLVRTKKKLLIAGLGLIIIIFVARIFVYAERPPSLEWNNYIYWNTFLRADSFLTGFVLYMLIENGLFSKSSKFASVPFIVCISFLAIGCVYQESMKFNSFFIRGGIVLVEFAGMCLLLFCIREKTGITKRITNLRVLQQLGKISYGLYIFHWPIFLFGFTLFHIITLKLNIVIAPHIIQVLNIIFSSFVSITISKLSYRYFESYFLKLKINYPFPKQRKTSTADTLS